MLPREIELAIQMVERWLDTLPGQRAGSTRLRDLRCALSKYVLTPKIDPNHTRMKHDCAMWEQDARLCRVCRAKVQSITLEAEERGFRAGSAAKHQDHHESRTNDYWDVGGRVYDSLDTAYAAYRQQQAEKGQG